MAFRRYTFSEAAQAAGVGSKVLRNWTGRGQVPFVDEDRDEPRAWHRFSVRSVLLFALIKRLVDHNVSIEEAVRLAETARRLSANAMIWRHKNTPPAAIAAAFTGITLFVWRTADGEWTSVESTPASEPDLPDTFVVVDLARVAATVVTALKELSEEDDPPMTVGDRHLKKNADSQDRKLARALEKAKQKS